MLNLGVLSEAAFKGSLIEWHKGPVQKQTVQGEKA